MKVRTWSDEQLRAAVVSSTTYSDVLRKLGLTLRGRNHRNVQHRIAVLGIDTSHFSLSRGPEDDVLRALVPRCTSFTMVVEELGLFPLDLWTQRVSKRCSVLGISSAHFARKAKDRVRSARWSDDDLRAAVASSQSIAETLRKLGLIPAGGNYDRVPRRIRELGIDTSHFTGQSWNKGAKFKPTPPRPLDEILVQGIRIGSHGLKKRLLAAGLKQPRCERCGWCERAPDGRVPLELDHANGDNMDNRLANLRLLCPNCHALQPTHRGLNKGRHKRPSTL